MASVIDHKGARFVIYDAPTEKKFAEYEAVSLFPLIPLLQTLRDKYSSPPFRSSPLDTSDYHRSHLSSCRC